MYVTNVAEKIYMYLHIILLRLKLHEDKFSVYLSSFSRKLVVYFPNVCNFICHTEIRRQFRIFSRFASNNKKQLLYLTFYFLMLFFNVWEKKFSLQGHAGINFKIIQNSSYILFLKT